MKRTHPHHTSRGGLDTFTGYLVAAVIGALWGLVLWSWLLSGVDVTAGLGVWP